KGYGFPEVWPPYARAQELCDRAGDMPQMFPILGGIFFYHTMRANYQGTLQTTNQILELADRLNDAGASVLGHWGTSAGWLFIGEFAQALKRPEAGWTTYSALDRRSLAAEFNIDAGPCCADWSSWVYWLQGYPEQAEQRSREALGSAKQTAHPFTIVT